MYVIQARIVNDDGESRSLPTFYLDAKVQGITSSDHAAIIANQIIDPFNIYETHVSARNA